MAVTAQLEFSEEELLADIEVSEPLLAGGVRCHGGFRDDGTYVSPRTQFRVPAIEAWRQRHVELFGSPIIEVPMALWGGHFPNVAQARFLVAAGLHDPLIAMLTRIGTLEGAGANIRLLKPEHLQRSLDEDIRGTALDHLGRGLFEAHGRDEAGWEEEAGHRDMWFAARDIAFDGSPPDVDVDALLSRIGFGAPVSGAPPARRWPADIAPELEMMVTLMIKVLFVEVSAFHTFAWAEAWLSDPDLVAGDGLAGRLVGYIRADETPHVAYLATALTELRDRTWIGDGGERHEGSKLIEALWQPLLEQSVGSGREQNRKALLGEVERSCLLRPDGTELLAEFHSLAA